LADRPTRTFVPADWVRFPRHLARPREVRRARQQAVEQALRIGPHALEVQRRDGDLRVPWDEVEQVTAHPDGERVVRGRDGTTITVDPLAWRRGHRAVAALDEIVTPVQRGRRLAPDPRLPAHADVAGPVRLALAATGGIVVLGLLGALVAALLTQPLSWSTRAWMLAIGALLVGVVVVPVQQIRAGLRLRRRLHDTPLDPRRNRGA
jgi:hypothetical protein